MSQAATQVPAITAETLSRKIGDRTAKVGIVGLGYVGLPLAVEFAKAGFSVTGIDLVESKVQRVNAGDSYIQDISSAEMFALVEQDAARRQVDEFGCGLDACDQLGVVRGEMAFQNGLQQVVSVSIVPVRFRHGRASHRWTTEVCQIVLRFAIPFQSRPAAGASHAAWRTGRIDCSS